MIVFLDTSALVKLYIAESDHERVLEWTGAQVVGVSRLVYPEARGALARRAREGVFGADDLRRAVDALDADMAGFAIIEVDAMLAGVAGRLAERRALRGFDALHLASALRLRELVRRPVDFACFDARLCAAAEEEGLRIAR